MCPVGTAGDANAHIQLSSLFDRHFRIVSPGLGAVAVNVGVNARLVQLAEFKARKSLLIQGVDLFPDGFIGMTALGEPPSGLCHVALVRLIII